MKPKICLMGLLCLFLRVDAQLLNQTIQLKVGDKLPDVTINNIVNSPNASLKMADLKGKLLILDFWGTYCTSCLHHLPTVDSIQHEFKDDLNVLLVDSYLKSETKEKILTALERLNVPGKPNFSLPSVINDTVLTKLFPHYSVPHYVWIDKDGYVVSITSGEELTRENIRTLLKTNQAPKYQKHDFSSKRPLYTVEDLPVDHLQQFSILLKGKIDGIGQGGMRVINDTTRGIVLHNFSLLTLYQTVVWNKIPGFSDNRIVFELKDPSKIYYRPSGQKRNDWNRENFYSYELIVPANKMPYLYDFVLDDLNRYTDYHAEFENRKMTCWVLERDKNADLMHSKGGMYFNRLGDTSHSELSNSPVLSLCVYLNQISNNAIIIDKTGYTQNIDLDFKRPVRDMASMAIALEPYGLKLYQSYQDVNMLVIRDKNN